MLLERLNMVRIYMAVTHRVDELSSFEAADLSQHASQECVRGNVKWHSESNVAGSLVHLAGETWLLIASNVELCKNVAWGKSHLWNGSWVPSGHHDSPAVGVLFELLDH